MTNWSVEAMKMYVQTYGRKNTGTQRSTKETEKTSKVYWVLKSINSRSLPAGDILSGKYFGISLMTHTKDTLQKYDYWPGSQFLVPLPNIW